MTHEPFSRSSSAIGSFSSKPKASDTGMARLLSQSFDVSPSQSSPSSRRVSQDGYYVSSNKSVEAYQATLSKISQLEAVRRESQSGIVKREKSQSGAMIREELSRSGSGGYKYASNGMFHETNGISAARSAKDGKNSFEGAVGGASEGKTYKSSIAETLDPSTKSYLDQSRLRTFPEQKQSQILQEGAGMMHASDSPFAKSRVSTNGYDTWKTSVNGSIQQVDSGLTLAPTSPKKLSKAVASRPKTSMVHIDPGISHAGQEHCVLGSQKSNNGHAYVTNLEQNDHGLTIGASGLERKKSTGQHTGKLTYSQIMDKASEAPSSPAKVMAHSGKATASVFIGAQEAMIPDGPSRPRTKSYAGMATASSNPGLTLTHHHH